MQLNSLQILFYIIQVFSQPHVIPEMTEEQRQMHRSSLTHLVGVCNIRHRGEMENTKGIKVET